MIWGCAEISDRAEEKGVDVCLPPVSSTRRFVSKMSAAPGLTAADYRRQPLAGALPAAE